MVFEFIELMYQENSISLNSNTPKNDRFLHVFKIVVDYNIVYPIKKKKNYLAILAIGN